MLVPKKNGKLRLVINYRQLNKQTVKSCWPLPSVEEFFVTQKRSCCFSTIDMSWGFYQLPLETSSQGCIAFSTPFGPFKWLVMPMSLTGSSPVLQSLMEKVIVGLTWKSTIPYLDDCIIFSGTAEEHIERLREVFQRFKDANLKINSLKCYFLRQHVHFLSRSGQNVSCAPVSITEIGYPGLKFMGTLLVLPTVRSQFRSNCSTSSSANRKKRKSSSGTPKPKTLLNNWKIASHRRQF